MGLYDGNRYVFSQRNVRENASLNFTCPIILCPCGMWEGGIFPRVSKLRGRGSVEPKIVVCKGRQLQKSLCIGLIKIYVTNYRKICCPLCSKLIVRKAFIVAELLD